MTDLTPVSGEAIPLAASLTNDASVIAVDGTLERRASRSTLLAWLGAIPTYDPVVQSDVTYRVPSDFATVQAAFDSLGANLTLNGVTVTILIESGHEIDYPVSVQGGDWSRFTLASEDATVPVSTDFDENTNVFSFFDCITPKWKIILDCQGAGRNGVWLEGAKFCGFSGPYGVHNAGAAGSLNPRGCGLFAWKGSQVYTVPATGPLTGMWFRGNAWRGVDITHNSQCTLVASLFENNGTDPTIAAGHAHAFASRASSVQLDNSIFVGGVRGIRSARSMVTARTSTFTDIAGEVARQFEGGFVNIAGSTMTDCGASGYPLLIVEGADGSRPQGGGEIIAESSVISGPRGEIAVTSAANGFIDLNDCRISDIRNRIARIGAGGRMAAARLRGASGGSSPVTVHASFTAAEAFLVSDGAQIDATGVVFDGGGIAARFARATTSGEGNFRGAVITNTAQAFFCDAEGAILRVANASPGDGGVYPSILRLGGGTLPISYRTRAQLVTAIGTLGLSYPDGFVVKAGGRKYRFLTGATAIADLPGLVPNTTITPQHFGWDASLSFAAQTAAIQAAAAYADSVNGPTVVNKNGRAATVLIPSGRYRINDTIYIRQHGTEIRGEGTGNTAIQLMDQTKAAFYFGAVDAFNAGGDNVNSRLGNVGMRDLTIALEGANQTDARSAAAIIVDRCGASTFKDIQIYGMHRSIVVMAGGRGNLFENIYIQQTGGGAMAATNPDSFGIGFMRREVAATDPQGRLDAADGKYYDAGASQYLANVQMHASGYGMHDAMVVEAIDGLYVSNTHFGFPTNALLRLKATQANQPILNGSFVGCFFDDNQGLEAGSTWTKYGVMIDDAADIGTAINDFTFSGGEINGGSLAGIYANAANSARFLFNGIRMTAGGARAIHHIRGNQFNYTSLTVNHPSATQADLFTFASGDDILLSDVTANGNPAYTGGRGLVIGQNMGRMRVHNVHIRNTDGLAFDDRATTNDVRYSSCSSDKSSVVPSATTIIVPIEHEVVLVTGTTNIRNIDSAGIGKSAFERRRITLVFDSALIVRTGGNIGVKSPFFTAAGSTLELRFYNGTWFEVSRSSDASTLPFRTRAALVAAVADGFALPDGFIVAAAGQSYVFRAGSTLIPDLPGVEPSGAWSVRHFGDVEPDGTTDAQPMFQAAADAAGRVTPYGNTEVRVNRFTFSNLFSNAAWTKTGGSIATSVEPAPYGGTMQRFNETAVTSLHQIQQSFAFVNDTTYSVSVYVRADQRSAIRLALPSAIFGAAVEARFNLSTGLTTIVTAGTETIAGCMELREFPGIWRCVLTSRTVAGGAGSAVIGLYAGANSYAGTLNHGLWLSKAQLETGNVGQYQDVPGDGSTWDRTPLLTTRNGYNGQLINVPAGLWTLRDTVWVKAPGVAFDGGDQSSTMIRTVHNKLAFEFAHPEEALGLDMRHFGLSNMSLRGASRDMSPLQEPALGNAAVRIGRVRDLAIRNVEVNGYFTNFALEGCQAPIEISALTAVGRSNLGSTGGYDFTVDCLKMKLELNNTRAETGGTGNFLAWPSGIRIINFHHQGRDGSKQGFMRVTACDGLDVHMGHVGVIDDTAVLFEPVQPDVPLANWRSHGTFWDQNNSRTNYVVRAPAPVDPTPRTAVFSMEFLDGKFNATGTNATAPTSRGILLQHPGLRYAVFTGKMDRMKGDSWVDIQAGNGYCEIDLRMMYSNEYIPANTGGFIHLNNAGPASDFFRVVDISGAIVSLEASGASVPNTNVRVTGNVNSVILQGLTFDPHSVNADGLLNTAAMTAGTVNGDGYSNRRTGVASSGTYTVQVSDASGNVSPTTVTGRWRRDGGIIRVAFTNLNDIVTTGLVAGDEIRISLPPGITAAQRSQGRIRMQSKASNIGAAAEDHMVIAGIGSTFMTIERANGTGAGARQTVTTIASGTTDILDCAIELLQV